MAGVEGGAQVHERLGVLVAGELGRLVELQPPDDPLDHALHEGPVGLTPDAVDRQGAVLPLDVDADLEQRALASGLGLPLCGPPSSCALPGVPLPRQCDIDRATFQPIDDRLHVP